MAQFRRTARLWAVPRPALGDLVAGVSVALVLIPQSMAYAQLAGLPPSVGLLAATAPPIFAAIFASSPYLQTGPVAMTSLLTFGALSTIAPPMSGEFVGLAALLALVVGVARIGIGVLRAGFLAYFMSQPVLKGFTAAAAILIVLSQVPTVLGVQPGDAGIVWGAWLALTDVGAWDAPSLALGVGTAAVILLARRLHPLLPGVLVAVLAGVLVGTFTDFAGATLGEVPLALPSSPLALPWRSLPALIVPGGVIALVGFAEAASISRVFAEADRAQWSPNREFVSQGVANVAAGLAGGLPVGGSFSRSSIARLAGARSRWTGEITGLVVLAFLPVAFVLQGLPLPVLGGIVIAAVLPLIRLRPLAAMVRDSRLQAGIGWVTFSVTLAVAPRVELGVLAGVALAVAIHLWRELLIAVQIAREGETLRITPVGVLFFASAPPLDDAIVSALARHPDATRIELDLSHLGRVDYTGGLVLRRIVQDAARADFTIALTRVPRHAMRVLRAVLPEDVELTPEDGAPS